jgi:hypothetical protein
MPGGLHDARALRLSELWGRAQELFPPQPDSGYLLADSAFPATHWIVPTFRVPHGRAQELFNRQHASARGVVERAFGVLKGRFSALRRLPHDDPARASRYVLLACQLHNMILTAGAEGIASSQYYEQDPHLWSSQHGQDDGPPPAQAPPEDNANLRARLVAYITEPLHLGGA